MPSISKSDADSGGQMKRTPFRLMILALLGSGAILSFGNAAASRPPDLSGTWNADLAKSSFAAGAARPKRWSVTIQQDERKLVRTETFVGQDDKASGVTMTFTLDGKENRNRIEELDLFTACRWEGRSLIIEGTLRSDPAGIWTEKLTLSPDGKRLRATSSIRFPGGQSNETDITYTRGN